MAKKAGNTLVGAYQKLVCDFVGNRGGVCDIQPMVKQAYNDYQIVTVNMEDAKDKAEAFQHLLNKAGIEADLVQGGVSDSEGLNLVAYLKEQSFKNINKARQELRA